MTLPIEARLTLPAPVSNLDAYIEAVNRIPVLDAEEERQLARAWRERRDLEAARRLVLAHLRFVVYIARGYLGYGLPLGDLIQEGNIGLMKAVKRFDPAMGVRLVSFAVHWIRAEIHEFILRNWRIVKVATTKAQRKLFFNLRRAKQRLGWLSRDEARRIAADLGVPEAEVVEMERRLAAHDVPFDAGPEDDDEGHRPAPVAYLEDRGADPAEQVAQAEWEAHSRARLHAALAALDPRSRDIVTRRWLAEPKATLQELAAEYGISIERVRQIENAAIRKMRMQLAA
ncbi:RNA polymerase sigma factor RpoH [Inmirania thermothiophila]|uniref:RNA polymerase sigma factor RpoH n=1 Tax=Inmirania thermothiophila TaxID=1750597 RepID=A0A3N1YAT8_9GAMM|nr:RNA polymerase sigma factor RpoH [Inmirania thermothiophila]ROR34507.1 RNA polymerase RpoH-like sigma 32 subunit [Inmirania thermothiophila]